MNFPTRKVSRCILSALMVLLAMAQSAGATPSVFPRGTTIYDPDRAFNGYTLFSSMETSQGEKETDFPVYLINMNGEVAHQWTVPFIPLQTQLLPNGNLLVLGQSTILSLEVPKINMKNLNGGYADQLIELTWDGKKVFSYANEDMHHSVVKLPNGHYLCLAWEGVKKETRLKVQGGFYHSEHLLWVTDQDRERYWKGEIYPGQDIALMFNDYIFELDPKTGKKVWTWHATPNLDPTKDIIGPMYKREEWLHLNSMAVTNDGDLLLTSRNTDSILTVDRNTGKVLSRWGNTAIQDPETKRLELQMVPLAPFALIKSKRLGGPHDARIVAKGCPGEGNITVYNNGTYSGFSRVIEIDPVSGEIVWQSIYKSHGRRPMSFIMGGAQRLPNGNTLISEGLNGRLTQITRDSEIVWEYMNPYDSSTAFKGAIFKANTYIDTYCPQMKDLDKKAAGPAVKAATPKMPREDPMAYQRSPIPAEVERATEEATQRGKAQLLVAVLIMLVVAAGAAGGAYLAGKRAGR